MCSEQKGPQPCLTRSEGRVDELDVHDAGGGGGGSYQRWKRSITTGGPNRGHVGLAIVLTPFSSIIISLLIFLPIYLIIINFNIQSENWMHIKENLLHRYVRSTLYLVVGVGAVSTIIGVGCAWFVTCYDFHGRKVIEWILILPMTIPTSQKNIVTEQIH